MEEMMDTFGKACVMRLEPSHGEQARRIAKELAAIARTGRLLPGSLIERQTLCGKPNCACHADPPRRHGPYFQWTRKVANKTVGKWLTATQHIDYQEWVNNDRRAKELLIELENLGIQALEADQRTPKKL
jgi:hypothetical protein